MGDVEYVLEAATDKRLLESSNGEALVTWTRAEAMWEKSDPVVQVEPTSPGYALGGESRREEPFQTFLVLV